ncbi:MAG: hypothetical protein WAT39_12885 [Planctomycetota bacterium]
MKSHEAMRSHAAADLFPLLAADEFVALKRDIAGHGQREPIVVVEGILVDGEGMQRPPILRQPLALGSLEVR